MSFRGGGRGGGRGGAPRGGRGNANFTPRGGGGGGMGARKNISFSAHHADEINLGRGGFQQSYGPPDTVQGMTLSGLTNKQARAHV